MIIQGQAYDLVILNGRVIDPESGLDAIRNVGIIGGIVQAVSIKRLVGRTTIDASGLIVAPGFIDLNSHGHDHENYCCAAMDGVTTSLALSVHDGSPDETVPGSPPEEIEMRLSNSGDFDGVPWQVCIVESRSLVTGEPMSGNRLFV